VRDFCELLVSVGEGGGIYALAALAYLLILRPTGIINFGIGELATLGAFTGVAALTWAKLPYIVGLPLVVITVGLVALVTERLTVHPLMARNAPVLSPVLVLLGMLTIYREIGTSIFGTANLFSPPPFGFTRVAIGPFDGASQSFLIIAVTAIVFIAAWFFFERTLWGKAFEAIAIDRFAAGLVGINFSLAVMLSFAAGGAMAALAGLLQSPLTSASYLMGFPIAIKGFTALMIGGAGRVEGALLGGLLLSLTEKLVLRYAPIPAGFALGVPFLVLILFLVLKPRGLLAVRG
jgi:branched-chain amino acid transport system permease protein